jgi:1-phosphofructokinase
MNTEARDQPADAARSGVCVFTPAPVLTITIEQDASDEPELHIHAGGQGFWVARMVHALGQPVTMCAPLGGETGTVLAVLIREEGVQLTSVAMAGSNGAYVHDRRSGDRRVIAETTPPTLGRHELDELYSVTMAAALRLGVCVLAGARPDSVLPPETYERLVCDLAAASVHVVADLSGPQMEAAVSAGLPLLKISDEQLVRSGYARDQSVEHLLGGIDALRTKGVRDLVLSRAEQPVIAAVDGQLLEVEAPRLQVVDHRGAGDSMTAGLAVAAARGLGIADALRLATAAGAANVTRQGLATGDADAIDELAQRVSVKQLSAT